MFENVRRLIAARQAVSSPVPYVRWKYLAFEHNAHEMEQAVDLARQLGVDEIAFSAGMPGPGGQTAPGFDPSVTATVRAVHFSERTGLAFTTSNDEIRDELCEIAHTPLTRRLESAQSQDAAVDERISGDGYCDWLFYCPAFDADGRVRACAIPDYAHRGSLEYGDIVADGAEYFNAARFLSARRATVSRAPLCPPLPCGATTDDVGCRRCPNRPSPCSQLPIAAGWHMSIGKQVVPSNIAVDKVQAMTGWSRHSVT